jgi:hypothetical protein
LIKIKKIERTLKNEILKIIADHLNGAMYKSNFRIGPKFIGLYATKIRDSLIKYIDKNYDSFYFRGIHFRTGDVVENPMFKQLEKLSKDELQGICMNLGMGVDLLWNESQMIYLITQRKIILEQMIKNNQEELRKFEEI